jgi:glycosyltransferase involved in cell wall biosynthesis
VVERLSLSAFIICKDEAPYIEACIRSLDVCAEIVVVDSGSTDGTLDILERLRGEGAPIRVLHNDWPGYAAQKQFALDQCTQDWCINVDADERFDADLSAAMADLVAAPAEVQGWRIRRRNYLIGNGYTPKDAHEHHLLRMFRRGSGRFDLTVRVHETVDVTGELRNAKRGSLLHFRPLFLGEQLAKENTYSTLKAEQGLAAGKRGRPWKMVFNPAIYFARLFFGHQLYRCGWAGFIEAGTGAVYAFMTEAKRVQHDLAARRPVAEPESRDV